MDTRKWYKLDNVGKLYAGAFNASFPKVFRYSAILKDEIDKKILEEALQKTLVIYPNFNVNLRKGIFWYYLNETEKVNKIKEENLPVCYRLYNCSDDFLYRVSYYKCKINLEISHILSDGRGSMEFFKELVTNYCMIRYNLNIKEKKINPSQIEKAEDSFSKYYTKSKKLQIKRKKVYIYNGKKYRNSTRYMECHLDVNKVLEMAHEYNTTLTVFLVSVLIYAIKDVMNVSEYSKYIKIEIPVDFRTYFKSSSIKNFFGLLNIEYKFKEAENSKENEFLKEIIEDVNKQFKEKLDVESLKKRANLMVGFEKNILCRMVPLCLKNIVLWCIDKASNTMSTTCLSNMGKISLDEKVEEYIESASVVTSTTGFQFSVCSLKDDLSIGISSRYINNDVIKNFCRYFSNEGIDVKIDVSEVENEKM